jgi:hypothetical protein
MRDPSRVRVSGPLEAYASGFAAELARVGYTRNTVACQLRLMAHVSLWLAGKGLDAAGLTAAVEEFFAARRAAGHTTLRSSRALEPLLGYLRGLGVEPAAVVVATTPAEELLERYCRYLLEERGLAAGTVRGYVDIVRPFLAGCALSAPGPALPMTRSGSDRDRRGGVAKPEDARPSLWEAPLDERARSCSPLRGPLLAPRARAQSTSQDARIDRIVVRHRLQGRSIGKRRFRPLPE